MIDIFAKNIRLVEVASTWQGEGPDTGRQMLIARFKYCNKHCSFCDTWIKMKTSAEGYYSIDDLNSALQKTKGLMITGGEPTLNTNSITNLSDTLKMIQYCDYQVANVETNGYAIDSLLNNLVIPSGRVVKIMYSPKIFNSTDYSSELKTFENVISHPNVYVKIVADKTQLTEQFIRTISESNKDKSKIYLMPLGVTPIEIASNWAYCIDLADECNLNISTRMHIMNCFV